MYPATVNDEMIFDRVLDGLSEADRSAVDRVLNSGGFKSGLTHFDLDAARQEGYSRGYVVGERAAEKKKGAA